MVDRRAGSGVIRGRVQKGYQIGDDFVIALIVQHLGLNLFPLSLRIQIAKSKTWVPLRKGKSCWLI
jgi:hypothetical protein